MSALKGKVAIVTGASRGVGRGIAQVLGEAAATVYVTGRSVRGRPTTEGLPGTIDETAELVEAAGGVGVPVRCDHTVDSQVESLFQRVLDEQGRLDLLVNNAWGGYEQYDDAKFDLPFWEQPLWRWHGMFRAGLRTHFTASRLAARAMIERERGLILNISFGDGGKFLGSVLYDVAKNAVDRLTMGMGFELRNHGIPVLSLYPGFVRTERVMAGYRGDLSVTQSPQYTGRAVVALATDPCVIHKSGMAFSVAELAREYEFTDIDGKQHASVRLDS